MNLKINLPKLLKTGCYALALFPAISMAQSKTSSKKKEIVPLGQVLYLKNNCINCHAEDQKGIANNPPLLNLYKKYNAQEISAIIKNGKAGMPPNWDLSDKEIMEIANYLSKPPLTTKKKKNK